MIQEEVFPLQSSFYFFLLLCPLEGLARIRKDGPLLEHTKAWALLGNKILFLTAEV